MREMNIGNMFRSAIEVSKKAPLWKKVLIGIVIAAAPVVAKHGAQKAIDKLFKDKKKSLTQKLDEFKKLLHAGDITEQEYQEIRLALLKRAANET